MDDQQQDHDIFEGAVRQIMSDINTSMPGTVVSYDPATRRAVVAPSLSKQIADGRVLNPPNLVSVPVVFPSSSKFLMSWPLVAGDGVHLHFSQRSLEDWHAKGDPVPTDPRQYDLSDAVAYPGLASLAQTPATDPNNFVLSFGGCSIVMTPNGVMTFHASSITTDTPLTSTAAITSENVSLAGHVHVNTQSQTGSFSGAPKAGS